MSTPDKRQGFVMSNVGLRLYWEAHGAGPALICCNGVGVSTFFWKYLVAEFSDRYTVVLWDYRGHGQSDDPDNPTECDLSVRASALDLFGILDAAGVDHAVALGHSMGCQVALEAAIQKPDRIRGLVLMQGSAGRVLDTFFDNPSARMLHGFLMKGADLMGTRLDRLTSPLLNTNLTWEFTWRCGLVDPYYTRKEDFMPYLQHMARLDTRLFLHMVEEAHQHDAFPSLPHIQQPTLVVAAEKDTFTPMWLSQRIAREMPNAEILVLADATHAAIIEQPDTINHRVDRFLGAVDWPA